MKQSGHLNPSEETVTGCPVTSKYGRTPTRKHGGVGKQQQLLKFVFNSVYVDLQYDEIYIILLLGLCPRGVYVVIWSVCELVFLPYVDAVVAVTVMRVLLFVLHVWML